jgi:carbonic anhydrase
LGTTIEVIVNGTTTFAGSEFRLKQFHMHTPSEHRIGEEYYPLELHFVHEGVGKSYPLLQFYKAFSLDPSLKHVQQQTFYPYCGITSSISVANYADKNFQ